MGVLCKEFDFYVNICLVCSIVNLLMVMGVNVDLVIFCENFEGFYVDCNFFFGVSEFMFVLGVVMVMWLIIEKVCWWIGFVVFEFV